MKIISSVVVEKVDNISVGVGFHGRDVCANGNDVDVVCILGESCVKIGKKRDVMHVDMEKNVRED